MLVVAILLALALLVVAVSWGHEMHGASLNDAGPERPPGPRTG